MSQLFLTRPVPSPTTVHFKVRPAFKQKILGNSKTKKSNSSPLKSKVSGQGITLTDNARKLFFRKHYNVNQISHCGVDPEDRRSGLGWMHSDVNVNIANPIHTYM